MQPATLYLKPGELYCAERPTVVSTLLGSCVAVTIFHPRTGTGAISHSLLPACGMEQSAECIGCTHSNKRYVRCSIRTMLEWFQTRGIPRSELSVKLFGGGDMFTHCTSPPKSETIGSQNIHEALHTLEQEGLRPINADLGGQRGRKLIFRTHTGEVFMKLIRSSAGQPCTIELPYPGRNGCR